MPSIRRRWLFGLVRRLQVMVCRHTTPHTALFALMWNLSTIPRPSNRTELLLLKGLLLESLVKLKVPVSRGLLIRLCPDMAFPDAETRVRPTADSALAFEIGRLLEGESDKVATLKELSRRLMLNPHRIDRICRKQFGVPVRTYARTVRLTRAVEMLEASDLKVEAIAAIVGFQSKANFYKAIRIATGETPGAIRAVARSAAAARSGKLKNITKHSDNRL